MISIFMMFQRTCLQWMTGSWSTCDCDGTGLSTRTVACPKQRHCSEHDKPEVFRDCLHSCKRWMRLRAPVRGEKNSLFLLLIDTHGWLRFSYILFWCLTCFRERIYVPLWSNKVNYFLLNLHNIYTLFPATTFFYKYFNRHKFILVLKADDLNLPKCRLSGIKSSSWQLAYNLCYF